MVSECCDHHHRKCCYLYVGPPLSSSIALLTRFGSIVSFIVLVTYSIDSYVSYVFLQLVRPRCVIYMEMMMILHVPQHGVVPGITYALIIIRFGMGGAFKPSPQLSTFAIPTPASQGSRRENDPGLRPIAVNVHLEHKTDTTGLSSGSVLDLEAKARANETMQ